jgi:hypothetical protein
MGRALIFLGIIFLAAGLLLTYTSVFSTLRFGRLPGDISIKRGNFSLYFPLTTCIVVSVLLTLFFYLLGKFK